MMEAVARRKANWLFRAGSDKSFSGNRRPQEDMVTSAVFGSIKLMSIEDRAQALALLLGEDHFSDTSDPADPGDIRIDLWPYLTGMADRRGVEPDVLLVTPDKTVIIEVKWHAPLSDNQIQHQIDAVNDSEDYPNAAAVVVLGDATVDEKIQIAKRRTWRDVSGAVQDRQRFPVASAPFGAWLNVMHAFLQQTDMARIFNGLSALNESPLATQFCFDKPGLSPWFASELRKPATVDFRFGDNT